MCVINTADCGNFYVNVIVQCIKIRQSGHQPFDGGTGYELDAYCAVVMGPGGVFNDGFKSVEQFCTTHREFLPDRRKTDVPARTLNDGHSELTFEFPELVTNCTRCDVQSVCCPPNPPGPIHSIQHTKGSKDIPEIVLLRSQD